MEHKFFHDTLMETLKTLFSRDLNKLRKEIELYQGQIPPHK
jgi:hypothetical protein